MLGGARCPRVAFSRTTLRMTLEKTYILPFLNISPVIHSYRYSDIVLLYCLDYNINVLTFQPKLLKIYFYFGKSVKKCPDFSKIHFFVYKAFRMLSIFKTPL